MKTSATLYILGVLCVIAGIATDSEYFLTNAVILMVGHLVITEIHSKDDKK